MWKTLLPASYLLGSLTSCALFLGPAQRPPAQLTVEATPERLERGRYLAHHVTVCAHCHSERDFGRFSMAFKPGTEGAGGDCSGEKEGMPGTVCASNITPDAETGIGRWTDGELLRAFREGVDPAGRALFPMMPYKSYRHLDEEDALALVTWVRSLEPQKKSVPEPRLNFPVNAAVNFFPAPLETQVQAPARSDSVAYGRYLVEVADCRTCHTPKSNFQDVAGMEFAGGFSFKWPGKVDVTSSNLTPDMETGLGKLSREDFIGNFKAFAGPDAAFPVKPEQQTVMPWTDYAGMTEEDLGAIYDYLRTLKPVKNAVPRPASAARTP